MTFLPARILVFALPAQFFDCLLSPHVALIEREVVHRRCFSLLRCTPILLQLLPLFSALYALGERIILFFSHVLWSVDCPLRSRMWSLKISVCARKVITFDIIMASDIVWPPALANSLQFFNCSIIHVRGSTGSYVPIIFTAFSSRSILLIALYLENICCIIVSVDTCTNPVS